MEGRNRVDLLNCWEITKCERNVGGAKARELGVCVAASEGMGHSCWAVAGTLCGGTVRGSIAHKEGNCMGCEVFKSYHRLIGSHGKVVEKLFPVEQKKYSALLMDRMKTA
jgi:hypothetical protein